MAKTTTKKAQMAQYRNLSYGRLNAMHSNICKMLQSLPNAKALSPDEKELLLEIKRDFNSLLSTWKYRTKEAILNTENE